MIRLVFLAGLMAVAAATESRQASMGIQVCYGPGNCQQENTGVVLDYRWTGCGDPYNCYINPSQAEYESGWGIKFDGNQMTLANWPSNGARTFLTSAPNSNQYRMFYLLNKELSFEVDVTATGCGMNSALYFITMESDGGQASSGYTGAMYGTGYCDAQPAEPGRPSCDELDIWEANSLANVYTTHPCLNGQCDPYGCAFNTYARGAKNFYGRGSGYQLDSTQKFTVVTRFLTVDGTDYGDLKEIQRFYIQNGRTIQQPTFDGYNGISDGYCNHFGQSNSQGGVSYGMSQGMRKGMVMSMSMWGNPNDPNSMTWMDNEPNGPCPIYQNPNPYTSFGNIKFGPIGSTV
ncbi:hypothetical protein GHT06_001532 [Daphnia sinensis]|uniref:cellulose 1,4-beta-cellobiosidase (non-reducing end) n=1 Tax=Daphnia sinensis TaxID=1820382 RepID=A0AAD5PP60_9CRUS|nr:hypothetical protein GHT06_001532 [Daphnia sinensis]